MLKSLYIKNYILIDELRLDFTFEQPDEVSEIIKSLNTGKGKYNPYCFERGIF